MLALLSALVLAQCPPPAVTLTIAPGVGSPDANGNALPRVSWSVQCPTQSTACPNPPNPTLANLRTEFAANPSETLGQGTGFQGASGEGPLPGLSSALVGAHVRFTATATCNNPGSSGTFNSGVVVFAPVLLAGSRFVAERSEAGQVLGVLGNDAIPAGTLAQPRASIEVALASNEPATVHVSGGGVDWSKPYSFPSKPLPTAVMAAYVADPTAQFRFTQPGAVRVWVELAGVKSADATFTVVTGGAGGGGGTATGGGASSGGGGGGAPAGGCSTGTGLLALWLLVPLLRRGRRRS